MTVPSEEKPVLAPVAEVYSSEPVPSSQMTIEWFEHHAAKAKEMGLTKWKTSTDKSYSPPTVQLVFHR